MRRQRPIPGGRTPLPSAVLKDIWLQVDRTAKRYDVSRSFVIATALADTFGITEQEKYYDGEGQIRKRRKGKKH